MGIRRISCLSNTKKLPELKKIEFAYEYPVSDYGYQLRKIEGELLDTETEAIEYIKECYEQGIFRVVIIKAE